MPNLADHQWLVSEAGAVAIARTEKLLHAHDLVIATTRLRKTFSAAQTALTFDQVALRQRARVKFAAAERMFFTDVALQQATSETIARHKASRFPANQDVFDLCCGIGGDLFALAGRGPVVGVERDPITALLAEANCSAQDLSQANILTADVTTLTAEEMPLVHIDPDRRPRGRRTTNISLHEPNEDFLNSLLEHCEGGAIKLAPASVVPDSWRERCALEWISHDGECKQLVAWFGTLNSDQPSRQATVLTVEATHQFSAQVESSAAPIANSSGRFIYEPNPAIIAARMVDDLAREFQLTSIAPGIAYLTADHVVESPMLSTFEVIDHTPMDLRRVKAMLTAHDIGRLEIKKRGFEIAPEKLRKQLRARGQQPGVLIITPHQGKTIAILARRYSCPKQ